MIKFATVALAALLLAPLTAPRAADTPSSPPPVVDGVRRPNIVFVFADDLGYADIQCMDPANGKIRTPCCDKLAREGMIFSNMHSTSSVCSPSWYGLLAGRHNWRTYLQHDVTMGTARPMMTPDRLNAASLLKQCGYKTAGIGKWHLGLSYDVRDKSAQKTATNHTRLKTGAITEGPWKLILCSYSGGITYGASGALSPEETKANAMVMFGSNLGNANSHESKNLGIVLAGGGFKHAGHVGFDRENNTPLSNLFVTMLQRMNIETDRFGSSRGTVSLGEG